MIEIVGCEEIYPREVYKKHHVDYNDMRIFSTVRDNIFPGIYHTGRDSISLYSDECSIYSESIRSEYNIKLNNGDFKNNDFFKKEDGDIYKLIKMFYTSKYISKNTQILLDDIRDWYRELWENLFEEDYDIINSYNSGKLINGRNILKEISWGVTHAKITGLFISDKHIKDFVPFHKDVNLQKIWNRYIRLQSDIPYKIQKLFIFDIKEYNKYKINNANIKLIEKQTPDSKLYSVEKLFQIGEDYYYGEGAKPKDYSEAVKYWKQAAEQGYAKAQYNLGICYENGQGVRKNKEEAIKWYTKAAAQGDVESKIILDKISTKSEKPIITNKKNSRINRKKIKYIRTLNFNNKFLQNTNETPINVIEEFSEINKNDIFERYPDMVYFSNIVNSLNFSDSYFSSSSENDHIIKVKIQTRNIIFNKIFGLDLYNIYGDTARLIVNDIGMNTWFIPINSMYEDMIKRVLLNKYINNNDVFILKSHLPYPLQYDNYRKYFFDHIDMSKLENFKLSNNDWTNLVNKICQLGILNYNSIGAGDLRYRIDDYKSLFNFTLKADNKVKYPYPMDYIKQNQPINKEYTVIVNGNDVKVSY